MRAPAIRFPAILRPRINEEISRLMRSGANLLLIEAPAGFGKTAALVQWSADEPDTFWLSAEHAQNLGELLQDLPGANMSEGGWEYQAAQPTTVIIDDYEFLTSPDVDRAVAYLLEGSENLRLVVLSRKATLFDTPLVTSRLRVARLRAADLEFTEEECDALAQMRGVGGTPSQWRLLDNVGHWPLGVQAAFSSVVRGLTKPSAQQLWRMVFMGGPEAALVCKFLLLRRGSRGFVCALWRALWRLRKCRSDAIVKRWRRRARYVSTVMARAAWGSPWRPQCPTSVGRRSRCGTLRSSVTLAK